MVLKVVLFANTDWYLYNFRLSFAQALRDAGYEVLLLSPPGAYGSKLGDLGFRWIAVPMDRKSVNPIRELMLVLWLIKLIRVERIDVLHGFTIKCAVYGSLAARLNGNIARVNAVAGMGYVFCSNDLRARLLRPIVRSLMKLALGGMQSRLVLQNPDDVQLFKQAGLVDALLIRLIPGSGVNCSLFLPRDSSTIDGSTNEFRVVLPARLLWDKGVSEYVAAARRLHSEGRRILFLLAGDPDPGNPAAVPEASIKDWVEEGVVEWLGHVDDMSELFNSVDLVVLPSYREGLPKGLIEAAACGLPLITTDVPGCREVVTHEVDGLLVPVKDSDALANAIARLQDDPELRARLGAAARQKALAEFDEKIIIQKTMAVYQELIGPF